MATLRWAPLPINQSFMQSRREVVFVLGQAGVSANLQIPEGLTAEDLETAEDIVLEWKEDGHYRAIDLVITVYKYLTEAAMPPVAGTVERHIIHHLDGACTIHETRY